MDVPRQPNPNDTTYITHYLRSDDTQQTRRPPFRACPPLSPRGGRGGKGGDKWKNAQRTGSHIKWHINIVENRSTHQASIVANCEHTLNPNEFIGAKIFIADEICIVDFGDWN